MRMRRMLWPLAAIVCLLVGFTFGFAQQTQQPTAYWYVTQYQVDFRLTDSLGKMLKAHRTPIVEELKRSGNLLEDRWLLHHTGSEWNVLHIRKFPTWAAMNDNAAGMAAVQKVFPDSARRTAINRAFQGIFQANPHRDGIYVEMGI
jgi:hypothetical protein